MACASQQYTLNEIVDLKWSSYALSSGEWEEQITNVQDAILNRFQTIPTTFLIWTHFDDPTQTETDDGCIGNHYHILVQKNVKRPSNSATCSFLRRVHAKYLLSNHVTARVVKSFLNYVRYLSRKPRNLFKWSSNLDQLALNGELYIDPDVPLQPQTVKLTKPEQSFNTLLQYVKDSSAKDSAEFMSWALKQPRVTKEDICFKYFYKSNFEQLVTKAIAIATAEKNDVSWWEALEHLEAPSYQVMSLKDSIDVIEKILLYSNINLEEFLRNLTAVIDKTSGKRKTFIIKGPTNAGKTLLMNSIKKSFERYANLSQGITNNFWLESAVGSRIIHHEEAQFNQENQEKLKVLMEGGEVVVPRKGKSYTHLPRTPYIISCNTWPWCRFVQREHVQAFRSRCYRYEVNRADWLRDYNGKGEINPKAWLTVLTRYLYRDTSTKSVALTDSDIELAEAVKETSMENDQQSSKRNISTQTDVPQVHASPKFDDRCPFGQQCPIELTAFGSTVELQCTDCERDIEDVESSEEDYAMILSDGTSDIDDDDLLQHYREKGYCEAKAIAKADYHKSFEIQFPRWHPGEENLPGWTLSKLVKSIDDFPTFNEYRESQLSDGEQLPACDEPHCQCTDTSVGDIITISDLPSTPEKAQREEEEKTGECSFNYYRQYVDNSEDADNPDVRDIIDDVVRSFMNYQSKVENVEWNNEYVKTEVRIRRFNAGI